VHDFNDRYPAEALAEWKKEGIIHVVNGRNGMKLPVLWSTAEDFQQHKSILDLPSLVPGLGIPSLIFHGNGDETLPVEHAKTLASWNPLIHLRLMDTGHTFGAKHPWNEGELPPALLQAVKEMEEFFAKL
jgi:pimeloyl-ACP methyl ester carboxylesterase